MKKTKLDPNSQEYKEIIQKLLGREVVFTPVLSLPPSKIPISSPLPPLSKIPISSPLPPLSKIPISSPLPPLSKIPISSPLPSLSKKSPSLSKKSPISSPLPPLSKKVTDKIISQNFVFFCKKNESNGYLSNWYDAPFTLNGVTFPTTEHHMMWSKAILMGDQEIAKLILKATSPAQVKALGRKVKNFNFNLWDEKKFQIVLEGNIAKFKEHPKLASKLISTGESILAEAASYDSNWGIGLSASDPRARDQSTWQGENLLGKILMEVRRQLQ